ncbi:uncharacterized protein LOC141850834 [Brevipalpus obovatus]|uniref:uncharacterized protein LOC141850834 n=1 Tax=Brevipalpus obovatus TaxID=246614 RepID=UPI003D9E95D9
MDKYTTLTCVLLLIALVSSDPEIRSETSASNSIDNENDLNSGSRAIYPNGAVAGAGAAGEESENEARGLFGIGKAIFGKFHDLCETLKETLSKHHLGIGSLHDRVKHCFERIINLEKMMLGIKEEKPSCPDYSAIYDKVKDKVGDYVSPKDLQSMASYLQGQLRSLDYRLRHVNAYLGLAFSHIKYLERNRYLVSPAARIGSIKYREDGEPVEEPHSEVPAIV